MMTQTFRVASRAAILASLAVLLLAPGSVAAHAELDVATPADGETVEGSPPEVSGTFTQDMEPDGSSLQLRDEAGDVIATGGVDPDDPRRMTITDLPELDPGEYEVRWTTLSAEDDELARDRWTFTVVAAPTAVSDGLADGHADDADARQRARPDADRRTRPERTAVGEPIGEPGTDDRRRARRWVGRPAGHRRRPRDRGGGRVRARASERSDEPAGVTS